MYVKDSGTPGEHGSKLEIRSNKPRVSNTNCGLQVKDNGWKYESLVLVWMTRTSEKRVDTYTHGGRKGVMRATEGIS